MTTPLTVTLIEDDPDVQLGCVQALQLAGLKVVACGSVEDARPRFAAGHAGIVVTDMRLPGADGLSLVRALHALEPELPVIMITGHGDVSLAVEAMRSGAYDFIPKPFSPEHFVETCKRALDKRRLTLEVVALKRALAEREGLAGQLVGVSPQMQQVRRLVGEVADTPVDVLIRGETGTGKEVVARALHEHSRRRAAPYVALNCGGLPDTLIDSELFGHEAGAFTGAQKRRIGKIEHAHGGTLFLDELESMPLAVQVKLLRVLQERVVERLGTNRGQPVDVRVVAATKDDLLQRAGEGRFRADLYYRLNVVTITLPPLRERREDIPLLMEHFMLLAASRFGRQPPPLSAAQQRLLAAHAWPGNVRELRNVAECWVLGMAKDPLQPPADGSALAAAAAASPAGPGAADADGASLAELVDAYERGLIADALRQHGHNITRTARALHVAKTTLADKVRKHGLQAGD